MSNLAGIKGMWAYFKQDDQQLITSYRNRKSIDYIASNHTEDSVMISLHPNDQLDSICGRTNDVMSSNFDIPNGKSLRIKEAISK